MLKKKKWWYSTISYSSSHHDACHVVKELYKYLNTLKFYCFFFFKYYINIKSQKKTVSAYSLLKSIICFFFFVENEIARCRKKCDFVFDVTLFVIFFLHNQSFVTVTLSRSTFFFVTLFFCITATLIILALFFIFLHI